MKKRTLFLAFIITTISACGLSLNLFKVSANDETLCGTPLPAEVIVFRTGHGSSALIQCAGKNILIDGGKREDFKYINKYLKDREIKIFDLIIVTHPHADHIGGINSILDEYKVKQFMMKKEGCYTAVYRQLIEKLNEKGIEFKEPNIDEVIDFGCVQLNFLGLDNMNSLGFNNNSIVCKMVCDEKSFLFTGDIGEKAEKKLVEKYQELLKADAVVVPHHGSSYSSSPEFVKVVDPKIAIVSANKSPEAKIKNRYNDAGAVMYGTYKARTLSYKLLPKEISVNRCFTPATPIKGKSTLGIGLQTPTICHVYKDEEIEFPVLNIGTEETLYSKGEKLSSDVQTPSQGSFKEICDTDERMSSKDIDISFSDEETVKSDFDTQSSSPEHLEEPYGEDAARIGFHTPMVCSVYEENRVEFPSLNVETEEILCSKEEKLSSDIQTSSQVSFKEVCNTDERVSSKDIYTSFSDEENVKPSFDTQSFSPAHLEEQCGEGAETSLVTPKSIAVHRRKSSYLVRESICPVQNKISPSF